MYSKFYSLRCGLSGKLPYFESPILFDRRKTCIRIFAGMCTKTHGDHDVDERNSYVYARKWEQYMNSLAGLGK